MATSESVASRKQPPWNAPYEHPSASLPPLKIYNSLTLTKSPFIPIDPAGKKVTWYCCGPTVYDAGHLGHARNYVSTDVLRRIMRDYFGFDVTFVENVTDVDDKIIKRARENFFLKTYQEEHPKIDGRVIEDTHKAFTYYGKERVSGWTEDLLPEIFGSSIWAKKFATLSAEATLSEDDTKLKADLEALSRAAAAVGETLNTTSATEEAAPKYHEEVKSIMAPYLDKQLKETLPEDAYSVFEAHSRYWEKHFYDDLKRLNCLPPTVVTRVSEFIPENVSFVKRIVDNGFAYALDDGSVYFDVHAFEAAGNPYPRLEPWSRPDSEHVRKEVVGGRAEIERQELAPSGTEKQTESAKKSPVDFALWKGSRPGEPSWESPWGRGRPGWHIECSAMCSEVLGSQIDIHSGGIDLAFPHHDNELAQAEAFWTCDGQRHQWVNYFIHMGHLSIAGSKMSKSLKNFISIRDAMASGEWTARRLRIIFMMGGWRNGIEITKDMRHEAETWETTVGNFFTNVKALTAEEAEKERAGDFIPHYFRTQENALYQDLEKARKAVHEALCDSFNTPLALSAITDIITKANIYLKQNEKTPSNPSAYISLAAIKEIARWLTRLLTIFGLDASSSAIDGGDRIGWSTSDTIAATGDVEETVMPYVRVLSKYRDAVKQLAINNHSASISKELLSLSDNVRDEDMVPLGVSLEDRNSANGEPALVKFVPAEQLITAREGKKKIAREKDEKKEKARLEREILEKEREDKAKLSHLEMFKTDEFGEWDENGIPTREKGGNELTKSRSKNLRKAWDRQKKVHEAWLESQRKA